MQDIIAKVFPLETLLIGEVEEKYPSRNLPESSMVTRICPSPTGFMHLGGIYMSLICKKLADQTQRKYLVSIV